MTRYEFDQQIEMTYNERLLLSPMFEVLKSPELFNKYQETQNRISELNKNKLIFLLTLDEPLEVELPKDEPEVMPVTYRKESPLHTRVLNLD